MVNMVVYIEWNKTSVRTSNSTFRMIALQAGIKSNSILLNTDLYVINFAVHYRAFTAVW